MTTSPLTLTRRQAQRLALSAGAGLVKSRRRGPAAVEELVARIGFVQIDTISVVQRAHHHILAARVPGYTTDWLDSANVLEYWAHAAAYLPWCDYRYTLPRKQRVKANGHDWFRADGQAVDQVLARIRDEGPLRARDFEHREARAGWWDWKPAKRALEYLFMAGELMVSRQGFQKVFDLTERVLPSGIDTLMPTAEEQGAWYVDRALDAWGIVARDEFGYLRKECLGEIDGVLAAREEAGSLQRVTIEGVPKAVYWVRPQDLRLLDRRVADRAPVRLRFRHRMLLASGQAPVWLLCVALVLAWRFCRLDRCQGRPWGRFAGSQETTLRWAGEPER